MISIPDRWRVRQVSAWLILGVSSFCEIAISQVLEEKKAGQAPESKARQSVVVPADKLVEPVLTRSAPSPLKRVKTAVFEEDESLEAKPGLKKRSGSGSDHSMR